MRRFCINKSESILSALSQLNSIHSQAMTLLVIDNKGQMLGTLTDGDIRRALIAGKKLESHVSDAMYSNFEYIDDIDDISKLRKLRNKKIVLVPILDENKNIIDVIDFSLKRSLLPIEAVLMAGGKGERLRPLTLTTPKPLLKIGDKAIIDRNIERLIEYGVGRISVTVNYLKELLIDHYSEPLECGVRVECVPEEKFYGTIGSLRLVKEFHNDTILVMNSDLLTDIDFEDFYLHFKEHDAMMSAAAIPYTISVPYGIFELEGRNIKGVSEKPVYNYYANAGIYLIKKEVLELIPEKTVFNATDLIDKLVSLGNRVIRYPLTGLWLDIGTPSEYKKAQELSAHLNSF